MAAESSRTLYPSEKQENPPEVEEKISPVRHSLTTTRASRSISIAGWTISSTKLPISSSVDSDELAAKLGIPVPEMTFGSNSVTIEGPNGWKCEFNTLQALDAVNKTGSEGIKVSYSEQWNKTRFMHDLSLLTSEQKIAKISKEFSNPTTGHTQLLIGEPSTTP